MSRREMFIAAFAFSMTLLATPAFAGETFEMRLKCSERCQGRVFITMTVTNLKPYTIHDCLASIEIPRDQPGTLRGNMARLGAIRPGESVQHIFQVHFVPLHDFRYTGHIAWNCDAYDEPVAKWVGDDVHDVVNQVVRHNLIDTSGFDRRRIDDYNREADFLNAERNRLLRLGHIYREVGEPTSALVSSANRNK